MHTISMLNVRKMILSDSMFVLMKFKNNTDFDKNVIGT